MCFDENNFILILWGHIEERVGGEIIKYGLKLKLHLTSDGSSVTWMKMKILYLKKKILKVKT